MNTTNTQGTPSTLFWCILPFPVPIHEAHHKCISLLGTFEHLRLPRYLHPHLCLLTLDFPIEDVLLQVASTDDKIWIADARTALALKVLFQGIADF